MYYFHTFLSMLFPWFYDGALIQCNAIEDVIREKSIPRHDDSGLDANFSLKAFIVFKFCDASLSKTISCEKVILIVLAPRFLDMHSLIGYKLALGGRRSIVYTVISELHKYVILIIITICFCLSWRKNPYESLTLV